MKRINFFCFFVCLLLLASCKKTGEFFPSVGDKEENTTTLKNGQHKGKQFMLSSMQLHRNNLGTAGEPLIIFKFQFNNKGQLDSVAFDPQVIGGYTVFRSKGTIDSVVYTLFGTYSNGLRTTSRSGFEYDKRGNITGFNITSLLNGETQPIGITYDQGHVRQITQFNTANPSLNTSYTFTYNGDNVARWTTVSGSSIQDIKYTYDRTHVNPVQFVDDLLPVFYLTFGWEFFLDNENVSTSKFNEQSQQLLPYQNFYDSKGRLIKKAWKEPSMANSDSLTFQYGK